MKIKNILILLIIILIILTNNALGVTRTVCISGCDYTTIGAAVSASNPYDVIDVYTGTYNENININVPYLTLKGNGYDNTHIYLNDLTISITTSHVNISGFNVSGGTTLFSDGIFSSNDYINISYNKISNVGYGIYASGTNGHVFLNNHLINCDNYGIRGYDISNTYIINNEIENMNCGISMSEGTQVNINNNSIHHCVKGLIIEGELINFNIFTNYIQYCGKGICVDIDPISLIVYNNYFSDNTINGFEGSTGTKWNITKQLGTNIVNGDYLGGNYWDNYNGVDNNDDGLGDTLLPYTDNNNILLGGDYHPLTFYIPSLSNTTYTNYTPIFNDLFKDISVWSFLIVIFGTYETFCGGNLFWLILIIIPFIMTWIKQGSVIIPSVMALICGGTLFALIPVAAIGPVKILLTIGIAGIFYHIIKSR